MGSPVDDALITSFGRLIEVYSALDRRLGRSMEARAGLSHAWFEVLLRLARTDTGRLSMGELAEQVALTTGGVTRLLDRMVAAGLVERQPCPTDRRVTFAALTPAGREKVEEAAEVHVDDLRSAFAPLSAAERRTLDGLLDKLRGLPS